MNLRWDVFGKFMALRLVSAALLLVALTACGGSATNAETNAVAEPEVATSDSDDTEASGDPADQGAETEPEVTGSDSDETPISDDEAEPDDEAEAGADEPENPTSDSEETLASDDEADQGSDAEPETETKNDPPEQVVVSAPDSPPYDGTIFIASEVVNASDPSAFESITALGTGGRTMYDRRSGWITTTPTLFLASYDDGLTIEIQVNPEFTETEAAEEAERYARLFGQLPTLLRKDVDTSWIHKGVQPWGGGNRNLLVHTGQAELYFADGIAEETLIHEAAHTSLDADWAAAAGWQSAQTADPTFISTYARDNPDREDIAESFLPYVALRYRRDRISDELAAMFEATMPNRIQFFDSVVQDMYPFE